MKPKPPIKDESIAKAKKVLEDLATQSPHLASICSHPAVIRYVAISIETNVDYIPTSFRGVIADWENHRRIHPNNYDPRFADFIGYTDDPNSPNYLSSQEQRRETPQQKPEQTTKPEPTGLYVGDDTE